MSIRNADVARTVADLASSDLIEPAHIKIAERYVLGEDMTTMIGRK